MQQSATLIAVIHILIAFFLVVIVLLQDSKGGGAGGAFGGGSSQSLFGASGGATFMVKLTRYLAFGFMITCIVLTIISAKSSKSVVDGSVIPNAPVPAASSPTETKK